MRFAFYPGCAALAIAKEAYRSTLLLAERLGLELVEMVRANCCGAGLFNDKNRELNLTLNGRTLAQAEEMGLPIMTICNTCFMVLNRARAELDRDDYLRDKVNHHLARIGLRYRGEVKVKHLLQVVVEDVGIDRVKGLVRRPLRRLQVGAFYGCHILRPSEAVAFEDPDRPRSLDDLILAIGAEPVDYEGRTKCCGFQLDLVSPHLAYRMIGKRIMECRDRGGETMITGCPLCHINLDSYQGYAGKEVGFKLDMPTFHLSQLLGFAMGFSEEEMGFAKHLVSPERVLKDRGLL